MPQLPLACVLKILGGGGKSRERLSGCCAPRKPPPGENREFCRRGNCWGLMGAHLVPPHPVAGVHDERFSTMVVLTNVQAALGALVFYLQQGEK